MKRKKKIFIECCISVVAIAVTIGIGFWFNAYQAEQNQISLLPVDNAIYTMELGSVIPSDANIFIDTENTSEKMKNSNKDIQLIYTDDQIITKEDGSFYLKVGDYKGTIVSRSKNLPFTLHIVDTTEPEVTLLQETVSFDYGVDLSDYDWNQHISVTDLDEVSIIVDQAVDTGTTGSYTVKYMIVDSSGNSVKKELVATVNEKIAPTKKNTSTSLGCTATNKSTSSERCYSYESSGSDSSGFGNFSGGLTPGQSWKVDTDYVGTTNGSDIYGSDWIPIP